jgi:hypothetical protein
MSTDTNSVQACKGWQCLTRVPDNPEQAGWRDGYCPECIVEIWRDQTIEEWTAARNEIETQNSEANDIKQQLADARMAFAIATDELVVEQSSHRRTREQRDTLAEALRNLMAVIDSHDIQTEDCDRRGHLYCDCLHRARKPALTALATLDPNRHNTQAQPPSVG